MRNHIHTQIRVNALFKTSINSVIKDTHRILTYVLLLQWLAAVVFAAFSSPSTWKGGQSTIHPHLISALVLGAVINSLPLYLIRVAPFSPLTRHVVVVSQMLWSALLIHISGGRIESHFHVFGSLAFVAFYRDWTLLVTATSVTAGDHLLRGTFWPESVYGTQQPEVWRFLEHTGWMVFESVVLIFACIRSLDEMRIAAVREAKLENMLV